MDWHEVIGAFLIMAGMIVCSLVVVIIAGDPEPVLGDLRGDCKTELWYEVIHAPCYGTNMVLASGCTIEQPARYMNEDELGRFCQ